MGVESPLDSADEYLLSQLPDTYKALARWQRRGAQLPPEQPQQGSELDIDAAIFPQFPPWKMAFISLLAAGEHLMVMRDTLAQKQLYTTASYTVIRGALVGASQAVWALTPADRDMRRDRGLALIREMHTRLIQAHEDYDAAQLSSSDLTELAGKIEWLKARKTALTAAMTSSVTVNQTDFITQAANHVFRTQKSQRATRDLWRQLSADAHVLAWAMLQRAEYRDRNRRTDLSTAVMTGGVPATVNAYFAAYRILKFGWALFDQRGEARS